MLEKELNDDLNIALEASKGAGDISMKYYKHDFMLKLFILLNIKNIKSNCPRKSTIVK